MKLPKAYQPSDYEANIYELWESRGAFKPSGHGSGYSIVVPPPNANGNLHLGHGLTLALEDILVRYHRQKGNNVLFVPGADHAGFETQVVYERELARQGKSRFDFTREELYRQIWDFVAQNRSNFERQIRQLGASVDWQHYTFTLEEKVVRQAYTTFKKMWDEGLIYRGERLVNFCTFHGTAFADIEVEYKEEPGHLWHIRYPLTDGSGEVVVATTRPETMLGDTAVAVNPNDARYKALVGKTAKLPLTEREIPILADEFVDMNFGTGAVKITPAHDPNDFEAGRRHDLPQISVISHEGKMVNVPERYLGKTVREARELIVNDLKEQGYLVKTEPHTHNVGHCYKCGTVIEPLLREQWFIHMKPLAEPALAALRSGRVKFYPESKRAQLIGYLEGLKDWNISRQIAWGIPIPAFQNVDEPDDWIFDARVEQEIIEADGKTYRRDPDVFDTWFSSSSWPYATLGYPDSTDFKQFYPLNVMETGADILFPWVSRMLMFGLYTTGEVPLRAVYLHGIIQDEHGQKMSKSKGNVINPIDKVELYGADALRMGIISDESPGANRPFDESKLVGARNFCNKLWNIARYTESLSGTRGEAKPASPADHWILAKLGQAQPTIHADLDNYRFAEAYARLYRFVWDDLADWYIEASKAQPNAGLLPAVLEATLVLAHPFAPFVTETIWQTLHASDNSLLATQQAPRLPKYDDSQAASFAEIQTIVSEVRYISSALKSTGGTLYYSAAPLLAENADLIKQLTRLENIERVPSGKGLRLVGTKYGCWLDIDPSKTAAYLKELADKQAATSQLITQLKTRLANSNYVKNAPEKIVSQTKTQLTAAKEQLAKLTEEQARFDVTKKR